MVRVKAPKSLSDHPFIETGLMAKQYISLESEILHSMVNPFVVLSIFV